MSYLVILHLIAIAALAALFVLLRFRVHVHVTYQPRKASQSQPVVSRRGSRSRVVEPGGSAIRQSEADLVSALVNLGMPKTEAQKTATQAIAQGPGDFDTLLRRALQGRGNRKAA